MSMGEQRTTCSICGAEFLQSTAACTDGLCMPCYKGTPLSDRQRALGKADGVEDDVSTFTLFGAIVAGAMYVVLIGPLVALVLCLLLHYVFGVSWDNSIIVAVFAFLGLGLLGAIGDILEQGKSPRDKKMEEFQKRWNDIHGRSANDK